MGWVKYLLSPSQSLTFNDFSTNETLISAFSRSLEIIVEASTKVYKLFKDKDPEIPWRQNAGMGDKVLQDYFGVDLDIVWNVISPRLSD